MHRDDDTWLIVGHVSISDWPVSVLDAEQGTRLIDRPDGTSVSVGRPSHTFILPRTHVLYSAYRYAESP